LKKDGETLGADVIYHGVLIEESIGEMFLDKNLCHNFQYFRGGLGIGGNNMFEMREGGLCPSEYAG